MKKNTTTVNKMIKNFDKELRNLLLSDLKVVKMAGKAFVKNINRIDDNQLLTA